MTNDSLEYPESTTDLYLASCAEEVELHRPILTGDVFDTISIPGLQGEGLAIVLTHPCSMRRDGVHLAERLLLARVTEYQEIPFEKWETNHFKIMPLPGLRGSPHAARFPDMGLISSDEIEGASRVASLTPFGINLLQQRLIWYLTRFVVPTHRLNEACSAVFEEADLCEEWVAALADRGIDVQEALTKFDDWIRAPGSPAGTRQDALSDIQLRAGIRQEMRRRLREEDSAS